MNIEINGVKITLTKDQLKEIDKQLKKNKGTIIEKISDFDDILSELGEDLSGLPYKNPKTKEEKSINAQWKIFKIVKVYNEGTELDWKNLNQYKYLPYKYFSSGSWLVCSYCWSATHCYSVGLYYKSRELSDDALKKFRNIYEDYWM